MSSANQNKSKATYDRISLKNTIVNPVTYSVIMRKWVTRLRLRTEESRLLRTPLEMKAKIAAKSIAP